MKYLSVVFVCVNYTKTLTLTLLLSFAGKAQSQTDNPVHSGGWAPTLFTNIRHGSKSYFAGTFCQLVI